jgi:hypothetical protein
VQRRPTCNGSELAGQWATDVIAASENNAHETLSRNGERCDSGCAGQNAGAEIYWDDHRPVPMGEGFRVEIHNIAQRTVVMPIGEG